MSSARTQFEEWIAFKDASSRLGAASDVELYKWGWNIPQYIGLAIIIVYCAGLSGITHLTVLLGAHCGKARMNVNWFVAYSLLYHPDIRRPLTVKAIRSSNIWVELAYLSEIKSAD